MSSVPRIDNPTLNVNMSPMDERAEKIVDAAVVVFSRYGVKRTTMNDIAGEAGIVRQTLYTVFANKEEVLRATIRCFADRALAAVEAECATADTLGDKLEVMFEHMVVRPFELLNASPHAADIINGFNEAAREAIAHAEERSRVAIEAVLAPYERQIRAFGLDPRQLSDSVMRSMVAFKHDAKDRAHLRELLQALKVQVLALANTDERTSSTMEPRNP